MLYKKNIFKIPRIYLYFQSIADVDTHRKRQKIDAVMTYAKV